MGQDAQAGPHMFLEGVTLVPAPGEHVCHTLRLPPEQLDCRQGQRDTEVPQMIIIFFLFFRTSQGGKKIIACSLKTS